MTETEKIELSELFKALAHPVRLGVMELLGQGAKNSHELYEALGCSQSVMSQQLKILKTNKLVTCQMKGTSKYCSVGSSYLQLLIECAQETLHENKRPTH